MVVLIVDSLEVEIAVVIELGIEEVRGGGGEQIKWNDYITIIVIHHVFGLKHDVTPVTSRT